MEQLENKLDVLLLKLEKSGKIISAHDRSEAEGQMAADVTGKLASIANLGKVNY